MKALEKRIAHRLLAMGELSEKDLELALSQYSGKVPIHDLLVNMGLISPRSACRARAEVEGYQFVELHELPPSQKALDLLAPEAAWRHEVLPIWFEDGCVTVAMADPANVLAQDEVKRKAGCPVVTLIAERQDLRNQLERHYGASPFETAHLSKAEVKKLEAEQRREKAAVREFDQLPTLHVEPEARRDATTEIIEPGGTAAPLSSDEIYNRKTMLEVPLSRLWPTAVPGSEKSAAPAEPAAAPPATPAPGATPVPSSAHHEVQRRARELRRQSSEQNQRLSQMDTVMFEAASADNINKMETRRRELGSYEPPADVSLREANMLDDAGIPALTHLRLLFEQAIAARVEELELTPTEHAIRVRMRAFGYWRSAPPYPADFHGPIISRLRHIAGLSQRPRDLATDHQFLLRTKAGDFLCVLHVEPTVGGERALVRFPENATLLANPLLSVGLPPETGDKIAARLSGNGGGLLLISSPSQRTLSHFYLSLIRNLAAGGKRDVLSLERPHERRIPGVTAINCPSEDVLMASLANAAFMNPDVFGVMSVENGTALNRIVNVAVRGTTTLAGFAAPDVETARACFRAAMIDPMNLVRGVIGHLHVQEGRKLCKACARPIADKATLPEWAREVEADFMESPGCDACKGSGCEGFMYVAEYHEPDTEKADGSFAAVVERERDLVAASLAGEIDPRDFGG